MSQKDYEEGLAEGRKQGFRTAAAMVLEIATSYFTQGRDQEAANMRALSKDINKKANERKP